MKHYLISMICMLLSIATYAQPPQSFQYQSVVRDISGTAMVNQPVNFQLSIIEGTLPGTVVYVETHAATTNSFGIVTLAVGSGTPVTNLFSDIDWSNNLHFLKVEADPTGGGYIDMGTTQLLSVPYALYAQQAGNAGQTYTAGNGISITGNVITNDAPDQTVTISSGTGINVTGTYPNFNIDNTAPDQTVNLTGAGSTSVTGTYPNFTITSTGGTVPYTAGSGIDVTGTVITNTAPDQNITLTQGGATTITGTYPNFTISSTDNTTTYTGGTGINVAGTTITNTSPDQIVAINAGTAMSVTGTYPSFTVTNSNPNAIHTGDVTGGGALTIANNAVTTTKIADGNVTALKLNNMSATNGQVLKFNGTNWAPALDVIGGTPGGLNKTIQFNNSGSFGGDTAMIWDNTNKRLGVGVTNPNGRFIVRGSATAPLTEPLFEIKNAAGQTVFVVYPDSVHIYVKDGSAKSNNGGFAVSGRSNSKAITNNYLTVTPDSTRVFTGDTTSGFGVENLGTGSSTSYMHLTPSNYFIGHQAGDSITNGKFNSFFGYQCGISNKGGNFNVFSGYKSGYSNIGGSYNTFLGFMSGYSNEGSDNTFIGYKAGSSHLGGGGNVYIGSKAGQNDENGVQNIFIGENSGLNNSSGQQNIFMGYNSGSSNTTGNYNVMLGTESGYLNTTGDYNTLLGYQAGRGNVSGFSNVFLGYQSGLKNTTGQSNVLIGTLSGFNNTTGFVNTFIGETAGYSNVDGTNNIFIGYQCGYNNISASGNLFMGRQAGYNNLTGWSNLFLGNYAGYMNTIGCNNVFLGYNAGMNSLGDNNVCVGPSANEHNVNGINNVSVGNSAGYWSTGTRNVFIGYSAGFDEIGSDKLYIENSTNKTTPLINGDFFNDRLGINRQADTYPLQVGTDASNGNAAYLTTGGTWFSTSSKTLKDRFVTIDNNDLFSKIENLEIKGWFYKETQEYHIGPFAEDFFNAFGTGVLNEPVMLGKSLAASDVAGVSLLAVQELIKQNKIMKEEIEKLKEEIRSLQLK